jgi:hypothetical protein
MAARMVACWPGEIKSTALHSCRALQRLDAKADSVRESVDVATSGAFAASLEDDLARLWVCRR